MTLVDSHAHLTSGRLANRLEEVLVRAAEAGVGTIVTIGTDPADSARAAAIARRHENVFFTAGLQPHDAAKAEADYLDRVAALAAEARNVAIGEIGLDYHHEFSPRAAQQRVFAAQVDLARRLGKPVVVHSRDAFDDTMTILGEAGVAGSRVVFHSFTGPPEQTRRVLEIGAMVGFTGIVTFRTADDVRASAKIVPLDRLLLETDAPYLSPEPVRQMKTNEPANLRHTAEFLAALRGVPPEALAEQTTANARRFFGLPV